ncbi:MAG TPA: IS1595 family transposase [Acidobacteriaceae bacterium]
MDSPKTLVEAIKYFSDEQVCINAIASMRWPNGVRCPDCRTGDPYYIKTQKRWKCRDCRRQFSVKVESIFEDSPISLTKWLPALWLLANCKNGISSYELARDLGVTQKTAWFMLHRLRLAMKKPDFGTKLGGNSGGEVEVDESFVGGKLRNMHRSRAMKLAATKRSQGYATGVHHENKTAVLGILDRESRQVRAKVVADVKRETLQTQILKNVKYGSRVYTDQAVAYDTLHRRYIHDTVNHADTYVKDRVHTNGLENFWSLMKRNLSGTYVAVEPFHLDRYLDEQVFRFNNRATKDNPLDDTDRFLLALTQVSNRRLTYKELTGKTDEGEQQRPATF